MNLRTNKTNVLVQVDEKKYIRVNSLKLTYLINVHRAPYTRVHDYSQSF
jgi:hypothetical protein